MAQSNNLASNNQSQPLLGYGLPTSEPQLYDLLMVFKSQILLGLNCVKIGEIASYDVTTKTASINILGVRVLTDGTTSPYPQLSSVPVMTLQGGGSALQFPISIGDQCVVLFSDRNIDNWYITGTAQPPADGRLHDLSDGIAIVGLNSKSDPTLPAASSTETRLIQTDGFGTITAKVALQGGLINISNGPLPAQSLKGIMDVMLTAMGAATTVPQVAAAANAAKITLDLLLY